MVFGAGGDRGFDIRVTLDDAGAVTGLQVLGEKFEATGKKAEESAGGFTKAEASIITFNQAADLAAKGIDLLISGLSALPQILTFADEIEDISTGFQTFQGGAGQAKEALEGLRGATEGIINDLDLMQAANKAVVFGLPTEGFNEAAGAAVKLGEALGKDASEALNAFIQGVGQGNARMLKSIGIFVDAKDGVIDFGEAAKQAIEKAAALPEVAETAAGAFERLQATFDNQVASFVTGISANTELAESISALNDVINNIDISKLVGQIATLASKFIDLASAAIEAANNIQLAFGGINETVVGLALGDFAQDAVKQINFLTLYGEKTKETAALARANLSVLKAAIEDVGKTNFTFPKQVIKEAEALITALEASIKTASDTAGKGAPDFSRLGGGADEARKAAEKLREELEALNDATLKAIDGGDKYHQILQSITSGVGEAGFAYADLGLLYLEAQRAVKELTSAQEDLAQTSIDLASGVDISAEALGIAIVRVSEAEAAIDKLGQKTKQTTKDFQIFSKETDQLVAGLINSAGTAIIDNGIEGLLENLGDIGSQVGAQLGASYGPIGSALGSIAGKVGGDLIGKALGDAFFGEHFETEARQNFEDFLEEITNDNFLVREGTEFGSGLFDDFLQNMHEATPELAAAFEAAGAGFASLIENLNAGQAAAILSENLGGSVLQLKALLDTAGISVEQLRESIIQMALDGSSSFAEAAGQLAGLGALAEEGIPGQIGATTEAINELFTASSNRVAIAALEALGDEAIEAGVSLDQALANAAAAGTIPVENIEALGNAIAATGVSAQELADGNFERLIQVLANVESSGFALGDSLQASLDAIDGLNDRLANLPDEVRTTVIVDVQRTGDVEALDLIGGGEQAASV